MYKTRYFSIQELVHPWILNKIGEHNSWMRLDEGCLRDLDYIRQTWGEPIIINSGPHDSRGYRPPNDPDGAWNSVHKQGKAFDLVDSRLRNRELWEFCKKMISNGNLHSFNTLEDLSFTPTWVHIANMNTDEKPLIIKP